MGSGTICNPGKTQGGQQDMFGFGAVEPDMQGVQNMMTMMAAPWAAFMALSMEMAMDAFSGGTR